MLALLGLTMLGFAAYNIREIYIGFRTGEMKLLSRGFSPYLFRKYEPILFWGAAAFNGFLTLCFIAGASIALVRGISR